MDTDNIFARFHPLVGVFGGAYYDIYRPDYTVEDNTPALVQAGVKYRVDPTTGKFAEPRFEGVMYYDVFGPVTNIQSGDILIRNPATGSPPTTSNIMYPPVTVIAYDTHKSFQAFRTSRIGRLQDSAADADSTIYEPVYFDWLGQGFPGSSINRNLQESQRIPSQRAIIYYRKNCVTLRSHLIETDLNIMVEQEDGSMLPYERAWLIEEIDYTGPLMVLTLRNT